ncbi:unnamed protein product [Lathyrus sativus]|nr:unnamed protein product [Lathyrus sativus]
MKSIPPHSAPLHPILTFSNNGMTLIPSHTTPFHPIPSIQTYLGDFYNLTDIFQFFLLIFIPVPEVCLYKDFTFRVLVGTGGKRYYNSINTLDCYTGYIAIFFTTTNKLTFIFADPVSLVT